MVRSVSRHLGGAYRDRHGRGCGMRWPCGSCPTSKACADGEIVRSRSPDAEIKPCGTFREATVARQPGAPRRSRISRNTIAQGRPVVPARTCGSAACFFCCTRTMGAASTRSSLRPLSYPGGKTLQNPGRGSRCGIAFAGVVWMSKTDNASACLLRFTRRLERFRAKWKPVRVKKTRQNENLELRF